MAAIDKKATQNIVSRLIPATDGFDLSEFNINVNESELSIVIRGKRSPDKIVGIDMGGKKLATL